MLFHGIDKPVPLISANKLLLMETSIRGVNIDHIHRLSSFFQLMACQVRLLHPVVLAVLGLCLITYSSYFASSGVFQSTAPGTTLSFHKEQSFTLGQRGSAYSHSRIRIATWAAHKVLKTVCLSTYHWVKYLKLERQCT